MRRYFESLRPADVSAIHSVPDGTFLVRVDRARYRWHKQKPYYEIRFAILKPRHLTGCFMTGRLYCTPRAMWKLSWFLRDFSYDSELLAKNANGLLHLVPAGETTWYGFAREIVQLTGSRSEVQPIKTGEFPAAARRPANSVLDNRRAAAILGEPPHWRELLDDVRKSAGL